MLKRIVGLRKSRQLWLPLCNYITHVLVQSDTAGHYRAIGDQAKRGAQGLPLRRTGTFSCQLPGFHEDLSTLSIKIQFEI